MECVRTEQKQLKWATEKFSKLSHHPFLVTYGIEPKHDEDKTILLLHAIEKHDFDWAEKSERVTTAMLVEAALTAHEHIPLHNNDAVEVKKNQLTVLAGDLYSSLYYYRLAKMADIPLIGLFSESIQTMNAAKADLHALNWKTAEELEQLIMDMESTLIVNLAKFYRQEMILRIAPHFLAMKRIIETIQILEERGDQDQESPIPHSPLLSGQRPHEERYFLKKNLKTVITKQQTRLQEGVENASGSLPALLSDRIMTVLHV
ncbi:heptaprenyl diphosphate synthase component 1 [Salicibibacter cibarius]|uniref:Heptaprenyl diphosphate synthase component 1 n=1 Tax=Salicibibacter cibarius TaxID=2743000 RepID=A0A7T7CBL8_9BACI|nr:heptaprenyl diphosphate synthase component 1 [Salicibibacter cibarius]QQK76008.1 heptaprenyl diphosphate synthase component 1 [Salicibibacter cibarius]